MNLWTENYDHYVLQGPPEFDTEGAAKSGEIGCFNCAHNKGTASSGEVFCVPSEGDYYVEEPDLLDWRTIAECWECV